MPTSWTMLLAPVFESLPLTCPNCSADMCIVAFITDAPPVEQILTRIGEPAGPPPTTPGRAPPVWNDGLDSFPDWDAMAPPEPAYAFNQEVHW
jgi:hypothetical protein